MSPRIHCGTFESEVHWRHRDLAVLPSMPDGNYARVIEAMDEMMFVFCGPEDRVLNARQMNDAHAEYLSDIGFQFVHNRFDVYRDDLDSEGGAIKAPSNIFQRISDQPFADDLAAYFPPGAQLEPFAVLPGADEVVRQYGLSADFPPQETIRRVNTKSYSVQMRDLLGIENVGLVIDDVPALLEAGTKALEDGPFLLKDEYGVSGKGNEIIESERTLQRIAKYLSGQTDKRKRVRFVLEPYLPMEMDFSCQFRIDESGNFTLISVQKLENNGLAFGTSCTMESELLSKLDRLGYFELMAGIAGQLFLDGYHGDVCVDSMLLQNDGWAPLVEINARKSMSLIKNAVDGYLANSGRVGCLTSVAALNDTSIDFANFLDRLQDKHLLFETGRETGILPLTSGTLFPNRRADSAGPWRGRFYIGVVCDTIEQRVELLTALTVVMQQSGLRVKH